MAFFSTEPNLPDGERAKIEFHLQQIAECIGFDRFKLPVLSMKSILGLHENGLDAQKLIGFLGKHLGYDVSELRLTVAPEQLEESGGGG